MKLKTLTIWEIHSWRPCNMAAGQAYSTANLRKLFGGDSISVIDLLKLDIPAIDRLWVVLRKEVLTGQELQLLACDYAEHVLPIWEKKYPHDRRSRKAIAVAREYALGKATKKQLTQAIGAAYAAAAHAADAAADAAAYAAYAAAAADAARDSERRWQIEATIKFLKHRTGKTRS